MEDKIGISQANVKYNMTFHKKDEQIGELNWSSGELKFKGNIEKSAKVFFDFLKPLVDNYIKGKE